MACDQAIRKVPNVSGKAGRLLATKAPASALARSAWRAHRSRELSTARVTRLKLTQVHMALKCILWGTRARRIISVKEYLLQPR
jgi:hypothetical protein